MLTVTDFIEKTAKSFGKDGEQRQLSVFAKQIGNGKESAKALLNF